MNKKVGIIVAVLVVLLVGTGAAVYSVLSQKPAADKTEDIGSEALPPVDASIAVDLTKSKTESNTVVISVKGLNSKYTLLAYELTYDSEGLIKGVNSGSKPADVSDKDTFERPIYLGTCSRNVCKADVGVSKVSLVLEFTDVDGQKSQFSKDYTL